MARPKPSYLGAGRPDQSPAPAPFQQGANDGLPPAPQAYQSFPSLQQNVPTNGGPGPAAVASPQYRAVTGPVPAGPHMPAVFVQQYAGIDNYGFARNTYGGLYAGSPTPTLQWKDSHGWTYNIYNDYAIQAVAGAGQKNGLMWRPGTPEHRAIIEGWWHEQHLHPATPPQQAFMSRAAEASKSASGGLGASLWNVGVDLLTTITGGSTSTPGIPKPPTPPASEAPPTYAPAPDGSGAMVLVEPPAPPSKFRKVAPYAGAALLALLAAGGAYYYFGDHKRSNSGDADGETP